MTLWKPILRRAQLTHFQKNFCQCFSFDQFPYIKVKIVEKPTQWAHHVESTQIRRGYYVDTSKTEFRQISTSFPRTLFDVIPMVEKSTLFPRTFIGAISLVENSKLLPRTFFYVISMVEICTLFLLTFFYVILMGKNLTSFLVSCKLMKTFEKVFPEFLTLNS